MKAYIIHKCSHKQYQTRAHTHTDQTALAGPARDPRGRVVWHLCLAMSCLLLKVLEQVGHTKTGAVNSEVPVVEGGP